MPAKTKKYHSLRFTPEVIIEADRAMKTALPKTVTLRNGSLHVDVSNDEEWSYDNEDEFFADYQKDIKWASYEKYYLSPKADIIGIINLTVGTRDTDVNIRMPNRIDVEKIFNVFESNVEKCRLPEPPPEERPAPKTKVFIGHGQNPQWRDLKDHLHEKHGLNVEGYEIGARAGLTIKEVLDDMLTSSSFALLVLTGEDLDAAGGLHARENVIHELGLFQGRLGWRSAIALLEKGVTEFSNIRGLNQIRFHTGNIQETFGEVLATLKREFPPKE